MAESTFLSDDFLRQLTAVGEVDILVGMLTLNNRATIEPALESVQTALIKYFPRERGVLVNPDGGSRDGTLDIVRANARPATTSSGLRTMHRISTSYRGVEGRGKALQLILAAADLLRAKALAVVSPDLESLTPEWIERLVRPVYNEQIDFVAPVYHRPKFDGLLVKNLLSPLMGAVYGQRVREPVGNEIGVSGRLAVHYLEQDVWHQDLVKTGAELWMITTAMVGGFRLAEAFLGPRIRAVRRPSNSSLDLTATIQRAVGDLFRLLEIHEPYWISHAGSESEKLQVFGAEDQNQLEPMRLNRQHQMEMFRTGADQLGSILESILTPAALGEIRAITKLSEREFTFNDELWSKIVYEFAGSYHRSVINRDHLLQALVPLYRGRLASYLLANQKAGEAEVRTGLEALEQEFERQKPHLLECWKPSAELQQEEH